LKTRRMPYHTRRPGTTTMKSWFRYACCLLSPSNSSGPCKYSSLIVIYTLYFGGKQAFVVCQTFRIFLFSFVGGLSSCLLILSLLFLLRLNILFLFFSFVLLISVFLFLLTLFIFGINFFSFFFFVFFF
jgi:hypothetical protein